MSSRSITVKILTPISLVDTSLAAWMIVAAKRHTAAKRDNEPSMPKQLRHLNACNNRVSADTLAQLKTSGKPLSIIANVPSIAELKLANVDGLENCPYCDFAAICPPVKIDKEFQCRNPDCEYVVFEFLPLPVSCYFLIAIPSWKG